MFKKRCLLLQIGLWDSCRHPRKKLGDIWSDHGYKIPRLHISSLLKEFAVKVGEILVLTWNNTEQFVLVDQIEIEFCSNSDLESTNKDEMRGIVILREETTASKKKSSRS
jgi:hypothetical protein